MCVFSTVTIPLMQMELLEYHLFVQKICHVVEGLDIWMHFQLTLAEVVISV